MGNKLSESAKPDPSLAPSTAFGRMLMHSFEHKSGKMLCAAIRKNTKEAIDDAVEFARREFIKPHTKGVSNQSDFDDMNRGLITYLTQDTDIGDGSLFTQTPLKYAKSLKHEIAHKTIQDHLDRLHLLNRKEEGKINKVVGEVNATRAELAKERLKEFQKKAER